MPTKFEKGGRNLNIVGGELLKLHNYCALEGSKLILE